MTDNSRYADSAQARETDLRFADHHTGGFDAIHPDAPDLRDHEADRARQAAYQADRKKRLAVAMGELEAFFGVKP